MICVEKNFKGERKWHK